MPLPIDYNMVADLYDDYVTVGHDIPFFLEEAMQTGGKVLELTSGTGRISIPLLKSGIDLTCLDYSEEMLAVLRTKLMKMRMPCRLIRMDMADLSLPDRYDLIFIPFHSFSEIIERPKQEQTLRRIHTHLAESGKFICTLHNPKIRAKSLDGTPVLIGKFATRAGGYLTVKSITNYDASTRLACGEQFYDLYDCRDTLIEKRSLDVKFYLFAEYEFERLADLTGFEVLELYGDYTCSKYEPDTSPFMIWKLKKAGI